MEKSVRKIMKEAYRRIAVAFCLFSFITGSAHINATNSYFNDAATVSGVSFGAGYWIPTLKMSVEPKEPDGENDFYSTAPCVTLRADIHGSEDGTRIYYKFSSDGDPMDGGKLYDGKCVEIPDGNLEKFEAQAVNVENDDWKSEIVRGSWKVDTAAPIVSIKSPDDDDTLSGQVEIKADYEDDNPGKYSIYVRDGSDVIEKDLDNDASNFSKKTVMDWDTEEVDDGTYTIEIEGTDQAGNVSHHSVEVRVKNTPDVEAGDVIINEVMWMGSAAVEGHRYYGASDQWVELKNTTDHDIHLKGFYLTYKSDAGNENKLLEIGDNRVIKAGEYFLASYYTKNSSAIDVSPDSDNMKNFGYGKFQIKLYLASDKTFLIDTAGDGSGEPDKGDKDSFYSMARNSDPGDGSDYSNWKTCDPANLNEADRDEMQDYWDDDAKDLNCGTPGGENLY